MLVTHGVAHLPHTDMIIMMKDGEVIEAGGYQELIEKKGSFFDFIIQFLIQEEGEEVDEGLDSLFTFLILGHSLCFASSLFWDSMVLS